MRERFDEVDLQILNILQKDGRITNADLARKVGLSPPSVLQRVRKLEEQRAISGYHTKLNAESVGFSLTVFAQISLAMHQDKPIETFRKAVIDIPEVLECHNVSGEFDYLLKIVAKDMHDYERIIRERLSRIPGLGKIQSCFVLSTAKESVVLPI